MFGSELTFRLEKKQINNKIIHVWCKYINPCSNQVEQFWSLYNHMVRPSDLSGHSDYLLFKEGIRPIWEVCNYEVRIVMIKPTSSLCTIIVLPVNLYLSER